MIAGAFAELNLASVQNPDRLELSEEDLTDLWLRWLGGFAGGGTRPGWLDQVDQDVRANAKQRLPQWLPEVAAALCWLAVRPGLGRRERVVEAQPALISAFNHGLLDPTDETARYLSAITRRVITRVEVDQGLLDTIAFIDDGLWCARTAAELGLDDLKLAAPPGTAAIQIRLSVCGIADPLLDPRLPRLLAATRQYRRCRGIAVYATDGNWRVSLTEGDTIAVLPGLGQEVVESKEPVNDLVLDQLSTAVGVLADLFA
jgi:hypothetical protein